MALTIALSSESVLMSRTKDWSILILYTLNFCADEKLKKRAGQYQEKVSGLFIVG
jgi:hypothetical protein